MTCPFVSYATAFSESLTIHLMVTERNNNTTSRQTVYFVTRHGTVYAGTLFLEYVLPNTVKDFALTYMSVIVICRMLRILEELHKISTDYSKTKTPFL